MARTPSTRRPPQPVPRRRRAFTLVETITAAIVLAVAIPPMLGAIRGARGRRVDSVLASHARWLAVSRLEEVLADRHSGSGARGYGYLVAGNYPEEPAGTIAGHPQFSRRVGFLETGPPPAFAPGSGSMQVRVTVEWSDAGGALRSLAVSAVLTKHATEPAP